MAYGDSAVIFYDQCSRYNTAIFYSVDDKVKHRQPRDVYQSMVEDDSADAPRDLQQV